MASDLCKYCQAGFAGTTLSVTVRACGLLAGLPHGQRPRNALTSTDLKGRPRRPAPAARHPGHLAARLTSRVRRLVQPPLNRAASGLVLEYRPAGLRYQKLNFDYWATGPQPALRGDRTRRRL